MLNVPCTEDLNCSLLMLTLCQRYLINEHDREVAARSHQLLSLVAILPISSYWC